MSPSQGRTGPGLDASRRMGLGFSGSLRQHIKGQTCGCKHDYIDDGEDDVVGAPVAVISGVGSSGSGGRGRDCAAERTFGTHG